MFVSVFCWDFLDCELQEEKSPAGLMDVVVAVQEGDSIEVTSSRTWRKKAELEVWFFFVIVV